MTNQYDNISDPAESPVNANTILWVGRFFITLVGLGITLFGIKYTLDVFLVIYDYLQKPDSLTAIIEKWSILLNIKGLIVSDYPVDKLLVITLLAIGALLLLRITLGFIQAGTSILISSVNGGGSASESSRAIINLDYKLNKLKTLADQGAISKQAYENARDNYLVQKIMSG